PGELPAETLLTPIVARLRALGVRTIRGDLVADTSFFDERAIQTSWEWDDVGLYYGTPVSALSLNDGWFVLTLMADESGRLSYRVEPPWLDDFEIESRL